MGSEVPPELPLGELVDVFDSLRVPVKSSDRKAGPYPYYGASGITDYVDSYIFEGEHLLLSEDGDNLRTRNTPIAFLAGGKFWVNNHAHILRANAENNTKYLCYALQVADITSYLSGSTRPKLNQKDMRRIPVYAPPLPEQKAIAHILGTLDDKIELNRRMNATLEGMAQALFKSWFVDFDPVIDNALAAGNPIPEELAPRAEVRRQALANGTANREAAKPFPAAFQETESMGWIPEGWEVKKIGQILRSVSDTYPLKTVDKVIFLNTGDILDGRFLHENFSGTDGLPGQAKKSIQKDDILYSEIRPKNRRFAYVHFEGAQHVVSTKLMVLRPISDISSIFTYLILKRDPTIDHLQMLAESRSGTFPQITFDILSKIEVALPKKGVLVKAFTEKILQPTFEKQLKNDAAIETLTKLRDTLLPKLISGEIAADRSHKTTIIQNL